MKNLYALTMAASMALGCNSWPNNPTPKIPGWTVSEESTPKKKLVTYEDFGEYGLDASVSIYGYCHAGWSHIYGYFYEPLDRTERIEDLNLGGCLALLVRCEEDSPTNCRFEKPEFYDNDTRIPTMIGYSRGIIDGKIDESRRYWAKEEIGEDHKTISLATSAYFNYTKPGKHVYRAQFTDMDGNTFETDKVNLQIVE